MQIATRNQSGLNDREQQTPGNVIPLELRRHKKTAGQSNCPAVVMAV
jgi:hypothetical protein